MKGASFSYNCDVISNNVRMYSLQVVNGEIALCGNLGLRMRIAMRKVRIHGCARMHVRRNQAQDRSSIHGSRSELHNTKKNFGGHGNVLLFFCSMLTAHCSDPACARRSLLFKWRRLLHASREQPSTIYFIKRHGK